MQSQKEQQVGVKMSLDEIVDLTTDVYLFYDTLGLGLIVFFPVDGDTKYVIVIS